MSEKRRHSKAQRELEDTKILVDYLLEHGLSFEDVNNFTDRQVRVAKEWWNGRDDLDFRSV